MLETPSIRWYSSMLTWTVTIHPVRTISRKDSSRLGDFGGFSNPPRAAKRDNFAGFVEVISELLRILRGHTPTLFTVS